MTDVIARRRKILEKKYRSDLSRLQAYWPVELVTLEDILEGRVSGIRLAGGDLHEFDLKQVEYMASRIPPYLWGLIKVPLLFRYERDRDGRSWYIVLGGSWERRAVELLLTGKLTSDGRERLGVTEFKELLSRYQSLIFVSLGMQG